MCVKVKINFKLYNISIKILITSLLTIKYRNILLLQNSRFIKLPGNNAAVNGYLFLVSGPSPCVNGFSNK